MKQIVVISGKGGTGKTVLTASFAALAGNKIMADCDVDAANLYLLLDPKIKEREDFRSGHTAVIDPEVCVKCGKCKLLCRFGAVTDEYAIDPISCEGCGLCARICPFSAIIMEENICGELFLSETKYGPFVHAKLGIAEENSGKLVSLVRKKAKEKAEEIGAEYVIIDGPPGIGCPVIASLSNIDLALIVTEPTLSGMHDMERILEVTRHFKLDSRVVINKCDINPRNSEKIREISKKRGAEVIDELPFSETVIKAVIAGKPVVEYSSDKMSEKIKSIWERITKTWKSV